MTEAVLKELETLNPEALLLEPREVYDPALVGVTDDLDLIERAIG
jgi:hypothetical protein